MSTTLPNDPPYNAIEAEHQAKLAALYAEQRKHDAEARHFLAATDRLERIKVDEDASSSAARVFTFYGDVTDNNVSACMTTLGHWSRRDANGKLTVIFASGGGSIFDGFALFDFLRELSAAGNAIETVALGFAFSMGAVLLQAGDHRVIGRNSYLMLHDAAQVIQEAQTAASLTERATDVRRLQKRCVDLMAERSTMSPQAIQAKWQRKGSSGWLLDSDQALAAGLCDEIR
jgi:ATP-dependent Clp protease protease subunit